jgi:uncharacterized transporter YbjL
MASLDSTLKIEASPEMLAAMKPRSGWHSTKLHLALITMALITLVFLFVVARTGTATGWGEYCLAVISAAGIYSGSRVAESFAQRPPAAPPG